MFKNYHSVNSTRISNDVEMEVARFVQDYPEHQLPRATYIDCLGNECDVTMSDLYDLFNQQRIANFGADVVRDFVSRMMPRSSSLSDYMSKLPDDVIMSSIKSKNIQTYSELMQWSKYLQSQIDLGLAPPVVDDSAVDDSAVDDSAVDNSKSE